MPNHLATAPGTTGVHPGPIGSCATCSRARQRRRPTRQARGYAGTYDTNRRLTIQTALDHADAGTPVDCPTCGQPCLRGQALTAGHIIDIRDGGGPELDNLHAEHATCNYGWRRHG